MPDTTDTQHEVSKARRQEAAMRALAAEATLPHQRDKYLASANRWRELAEMEEDPIRKQRAEWLRVHSLRPEQAPG